MQTPTIEATPNVFHRLKQLCIDHYVTAGMAIALIGANTVDPHALTVNANNDAARQAALALPSALPAPDIDHGMIASNFVEIVGTVACVEVVRRQSSVRRILGIAATAQAVSCLADGVADRFWLNHAEQQQADIGTSAICSGLLVDYMLTRARASVEHTKRWMAGLVAFAGTMAIGLPVYEASNGGKLDAVSHTTGLAVGALAHYLARPKMLAQNVQLLEQPPIISAPDLAQAA